MNIETPLGPAARGNIDAPRLARAPVGPTVGLVQRLRRNFATVLTGHAAIAVLGFATVSVNTHSLGPAPFGSLLVIQSLTELFNRLGAFQTWQAINAFGAAAVERGDFKALERLFRFGFLLDCVGAALGAASAVAAVLFFSNWVGLPPDARGLAAIYASSALLLGGNASVGVLRLLDRFGLAMAVQTASAALLLVNAGVLWHTKQPFWVYVVTTALISVFAPVGMNIASYRLLRQLAAAQTRETDATSLDKQRFFAFSLAASGDAMLNTLRQRGEVLIVSSVLGPVAAGLYGVAFRLSNLMNRFSEAGRQSVYPEIAKLIASGEVIRARRLVVRTMGYGASIALFSILVLLLLGRPILVLLFGEAYGAAYPCFVWLTISTLMFATLFAATPYVQLTFGAGRFFTMNLTGTIAFAFAAWIGPKVLGLEGAGLGSIAFAATFAAFMCAHLFRLKPPANAMRNS